MADICLIVEGAYPYVTGGVSSWIQSLLTNLPDITFAVVHIGAVPDPQRKVVYQMPANVVEFCEVFINDVSRVRKRKNKAYAAFAWDELYTLHTAMAAGRPYAPQRLHAVLRQSGFAGLTAADLFYAHESWELLVRLYEYYASDLSFTDFFWTFRFSYLPIFSLFEAVLPAAHVYHAVSTGFGGLLGTLGKIRTGRPLLITEHGLYTREREIEIIQSAWMGHLIASYRVDTRRMGFFQQWWFNLFLFMEKLCYDSADAVISIASTNQTYQLKRGVDPRKMRLIPNGINIQQLAQLRLQGERTLQPEHFLVGFVGRIVPIKDVKTFIRALKIASQTIPNLQAYLVGPTEEDAAYFRDCQQLVNMLDLAAILHFTGPADVKTYYSQIDVLVLTSLSEGQPLVILEGNCAGVPVVATDVGACRELLLGISAEDQTLGASGLITHVASPQETAEAIVQLWRNADMRASMGRAGRERTRLYYRQEQLYSSYQQLYYQYLASKGHR